MRSKRIRMKTGDVFVVPFNNELATYSEDFLLLWEPKEGEECFIVQNIGMEKNAQIVTALYDGVYYYNSELINIDVSSLKIVAIAELIPVSMTIGSFKKVSNQLIPESTPYMIYGYQRWDDHYIKYFIDDCEQHNIIPDKIAEDIPRYGLSLTGGYMHWLADYFIKGIRSQYLDDDVIDRVKVNRKALLSNFILEAKGNPNLSILSYFGREGLIQDRDSYK